MFQNASKFLFHKAKKNEHFKTQNKMSLNRNIYNSSVLLFSLKLELYSYIRKIESFSPKKGTL